MIPRAHLITYVRLIEYRARKRYPTIVFDYAIGERFMVLSSILDGTQADRSYVVLETGLAYTIHSSAEPDPRYLGSVVEELALAHADGELAEVHSEMAAKYADAVDESGLN